LILSPAGEGGKVVELARRDAARRALPAGGVAADIAAHVAAAGGPVVALAAGSRLAALRADFPEAEFIAATPG
ncbi:MAG: hypothetical protein ACK5MQ_11805, partial [Pikeienuella sp.]